VQIRELHNHKPVYKVLNIMAYMWLGCPAAAAAAADVLKASPITLKAHRTTPTTPMMPADDPKNPPSTPVPGEPREDERERMNERVHPRLVGLG